MACFFNLLFLCCFAPVHFSQHPLPKKSTPFFPSTVNPRILFPLSLLVTIFHPSLINANYSCRRILNLPVNPARRVPGFMKEGKADNEHSNPCFIAPLQHLHFQFTVASLSKIFVRSRRDWEKKCRVGTRQRHRRGRAAKLSAHGEGAKFCMAASSQIKRHRRRRLKKLGAVGECAE